MNKITYKSSGVDIKGASIFKRKIKSVVRGSFGSGVLKDIGGFGSFFSLPQGKYRNPVLVSSADGVGTKLKVATLVNRHDTVGIDAVAMNVNDILCTGAESLFFLDYIGFSKLPEGVLIDVVKGINAGCIEAGCSLIGGETAQLPGMYAPGEYDLAGFCVGIVERQAIIDGAKIKPGDRIIGLESNGLHSNGYSLVRKVLSREQQKSLSRELLKPTRIYVKPVLKLLRQARLAVAIHGISHITGGAFYDKIARILPDKVSAKIYQGAWPVPEIFKLIQRKGNIAEKEMYHTFNMGVGMALVVDPRHAEGAIQQLSAQGFKAGIIGETIKGSKKVEIVQ